MDYNNLVQVSQMCPDLVVSIRLGDLIEANKMLVEQTKAALEQQITDANAETYPSRQKVMEILGVSYPTMWRWAKEGLLVPLNVGGKRRYRMSDVKKLMEGRA